MSNKSKVVILLAIPVILYVAVCWKSLYYRLYIKPNFVKQTYSPPDYLVGKWKGKARVIVTWCKTDSIDIDFEIKKDGSINCRVADTSLLNAGLYPTTFPDKMPWVDKIKWLIKGDCENEIIKAEGIKRNGMGIGFLYNKEMILSTEESVVLEN